MTDSTRLDGQVAIVTGAAQGIGRGIAHVLAEAGAKIVIGDLQDVSDVGVYSIPADGSANAKQLTRRKVIKGSIGQIINGRPRWLRYTPRVA